jgi:hypothetical protein
LLTTEEITELTPPRAWEVRGVGGIPVIAIAKGTIEPLDGGNRSLVTIALRFEGHGIGKLLVALVGRQARKQLQQRTSETARGDAYSSGWSALVRGQDSGLVLGSGRRVAM